MSVQSNWFQNYVTSLDDARFEANRPTLTPKRFKREQLIAEQWGNSVISNAVLDYATEEEENNFQDNLDAQRENLLGLYRFNFAERVERNNERVRRSNQMAEAILKYEEMDGVYATTRFLEDMVPVLKEAKRQRKDFDEVLNPDRFKTKRFGSALRIYDLSDEYSMSQYTTATTADTYISFFGATPKVRMGSAQSLYWDTDVEHELFDRIAKGLKLSFDQNAEIAEANGLTLVEYMDDEIRDDPNLSIVGEMWDNIKRVFSDGEVDGTISPWQEDPLGVRLLSVEDESWTMPGGDRDMLLQAFTLDQEELTFLDDDINRFIADNPTVIAALKQSKNGFAFISALNKKKAEMVQADFLARNNQSFGISGTLNMIGYGFITDPALPLDLAATAAITATTAGTATPLWLGGHALNATSKIRRGAKALETFNRIRENNTRFSRLTLGAASLASKTISGTGEVIGFSRRLLPTQILSELIFPSLKFVANSKALSKGTTSTGRAYWDYLKSEKYLTQVSSKTKKALEGLDEAEAAAKLANRLALQRFRHRAIGGALEGAFWGTMEYGVMEDYQNRTNSILFGNDAASVMAVERERSGAFGHMLAFGITFGAVGGPVIGEIFTQVGKIPRSIGSGLKRASQWSEAVVSPRGDVELGYENKPWVTAFASAVGKTARVVRNIGGANHLSAQERYLMHSMFAAMSREELDRIAADESGVAANKAFNDLDSGAKTVIRQYRAAGYSATDGWKRVSEQLSNMDSVDSGTILRLLQADLAEQEIGNRRDTFLRQVRQAMLDDHMRWMEDGNNAATFSRQVDDADPDNPPVFVEGEEVDVEVSVDPSVQRRNDAQARRQELEGEELRRRTAEEDPDAPAEEAPRTVEQVEADRAEALAKTDEDTVKTKQEANEKAAKRVEEIEEQLKANKKLKRKSPNKLNKQQVSELRVEAASLRKEIEQNNKDIADSQVDPDVINRKFDAEKEAAEQNPRNMTDEELTAAKDEAIIAMQEADTEVLSEASAYWLANPDKASEARAWYRKRKLNDRLNGDTNVNNVPPFLVYLEAKIKEGEGTAQDYRDVFLLYFSKTELNRIIIRSDILSESDIEFLNTVIRGSEDASLKMRAVDAHDLAKRMVKVLIDESKSFDPSDEETLFLNKVFTTRDKETSLRAYRETRIETEVQQYRVMLAKAGKDVNVDDYYAYREDPEITAEILADVKEKFRKDLESIESGNYEVVIHDKQSNAFLDALGEDIEGWKKLRNRKEKVKKLLEVLNDTDNPDAAKEIIKVMNAFETQGDLNNKALKAVRAGILEVIEDSAKTKPTERAIKQTEWVKRRNDSGLNKDALDLRLLKAKNRKIQADPSRTQDSKARSEGKVKTAQEKYNTKKKAILDAIDNEFDQLKENWIRRQQKKLEIQYRPAFAHTRPIIKILSLLQAHLQATATWRVSKFGGYEVNTTISRSDLISVIEGAESGYGFMINIDEINQAYLGNGMYDGDRVIQAIIGRLQKSNPAIHDVLAMGYKKNMDNFFGERLRYAESVYGSGGDLRNTLTSIENQLVGKKAYARARFAETNRYANELGSSDIIARPDEYETMLAQELKDKMRFLKPDTENGRRLRSNLRNVDDNSSRDVIAEAALEALQRLVPEGERITRLAQLGGGDDALDYLGPKRAARAIINALSSDNPKANIVAEASVKQSADGRLQRSRRMGAFNPDGLWMQHGSDVVIQRNFEQASANNALDFILTKIRETESPEQRNQLFDDLEKFINGLSETEQEVLNASVRQADPIQGLSFMPRWFISGPDSLLSETFGKGVQGIVDYNTAMMREVTPALMVTIHDAMYAALPTMFTKSPEAGASPSWNFTYNGKHVMRGVGFGFQTMIARAGTVEDALNHVHQIIYGYEGLVDFAYKAWNKSSLDIVKKYGIEFEDGDEFVGFMAQEFQNRFTPEQREEIIAEMFPAMTSMYMDADSSGSNIMLALLMGQSTDFGQLWKFLTEGEAEGKLNISEEVQSDIRNNAYLHVQEYIKSRIKEDDFGGKDILKQNYQDVKKLFDIVELDDVDIIGKDFLKTPVMTDSYGVGVNSMIDQIRNSLYEKEAVLKEAWNDASFNEDFKVRVDALAETLGTHLAKGMDGEIGGWIKTSLFGENVDNKVLGKMLNDWRNTKSGDRIRDVQQSKSVSDTGDDINRILGFSTRASQRDEDVIFNDFFETIKEHLDILSGVTAKTGEELLDADGKLNAASPLFKYVDLIKKSLTENEGLSELVNNRRFEEAQELLDNTFNEYAKETILAKALNSLTRQGYGFDPVTFRKHLEMIFPNDTGVQINAIFDRLSPMVKFGLEEQLFRDLAIGAETRHYVASMLDLQPDKILRPAGEESPIGLGRMDLTPLDKEQIRERTILQIMKNLTETYDLESLGLKIGDEDYQNLSWADYYRKWEGDSEVGTSLRDAATEALTVARYDELLANIKKAKGETEDGIEQLQLEMQEEAIKQIMKMLTRIVDSTNEPTPSKAAERLELVRGSENVINPGAMPGLLGGLPQTVTRRFEGAPSPILRLAQLQQDQNVQQFRALEAGAERVFDPDEPVFTQREFESPLTPGDLASVSTVNGSKYDVPLASRTVYNLNDNPTPWVVAELLGAELENFANEVKGPALAYLEAQDYQGLYNLRRHYIAKQEAMKANSIKLDIANALETRKAELLEENPDLKTDLEQEKYLMQNADYVALLNEYEKAINNALMVESEVLAIDGSWAWDAKNKPWSFLSLSGETLETISAGRTYGEAINRVAVENQRSGNMIAWLAPPAKTSGEVLSDLGATPSSRVRYEDRHSSAMLPRPVHSVDASAGLYMENYVRVTGWYNALESLKRRGNPETAVKITGDEVSVFAQWWDAMQRGDGDTIEELKAKYPTWIEYYADVTPSEVVKALKKGAKKAADDFQDENRGIIYLTKPAIKENVIAALKKQFNDADLEETVLKRTGRTLDELMDFRKAERTMEYDEGTPVFVNPLGVVIAPHKVVGQGLVNLTMQERILAMNGIQNQNVIDKMQLASLLDVTVPINSQLSAKMAGYDPFSKFAGLTIQQARTNAALLTEGLEVLQQGAGSFSTVTDKKNVLRRGTLSEASMRFMDFKDDTNVKPANEAREILALQTIDILPLSAETRRFLLDYRNRKLADNKEDWASAIELSLMTNDNRSAFILFRDEIRNQEKMRNVPAFRALTTEQMEKRFEAVQEVFNVIRRDINNLNSDNPDIRQFLENNDAFFGQKLDDPATQDSAVDLYNRMLDIEKAAEIILLNRTVKPDMSEFSNATMFITPVEAFGIVPRSDGTGIKPNTIDQRLKSYPLDIGHTHLNGRLNTLVQDGVLTYDQSAVLKLAFWDYDSVALESIFSSDISSIAANKNQIQFKTEADVNFLGRQDFIKSPSTDRFYTRVRLLKDLAGRFDDESLGPAAVVLEEIGHALGHKLSTQEQINFIDRVKKVHIEWLQEQERIIYGSKNVGTERYQQRLEKLNAVIEKVKNMTETIPENQLRRTELFGAMFAISGLHKAKAKWDMLPASATQEAISKASGIINNLNNLSEAAGMPDVNVGLFAEVGETLRSYINPIVSTNTRQQNKEVFEREQNEIKNYLANKDNEDFLNVDDFTSEQYAQSRLEESERINRERLDEITDENGMADLSLLTPSDVNSIGIREEMVKLKISDKLERSVLGNRIPTAFSDFISAMSLGRISKNQAARITSTITSPFGSRSIAFNTNGEVLQTSALTALLQGADSTTYFVSGAFEDPMPTMQALGLYLRGSFEKIVPALTILKLENATSGPLGPDGGQFQPWELFSTMWRKAVIEYDGNKQKAKDMFVRMFGQLKEVNGMGIEDLMKKDKSTEDVLDLLVETVDNWANPETGLWANIVDAMVDAQMVSPDMRQDLKMNAAYPLKFKRNIFRNEALDGVTNPRQDFRSSLVNIIRNNMINSQELDTDIFQIALADILPRLLIEDRVNGIMITFLRI